MTTDLKQKTIKAVFWAFCDRIGQQAIHFFITIILARLLEPKEFGLIAMLSIFMAIAQSVVDSGFGQALIQKQNANHVDECSIFYFNIFISVITVILLCWVSPWIAEFYNIPLLAPLTCILSLNMIINAFGIIQTALLIKCIDFKTQLKVSLIAIVLSGGIGIIMAYNGFGVWSLVTQSLSLNLTRTSLLWLFQRWRPSWLFSFSSLRSMFPFGSNLFFSGLLDVFFMNLHLIVIGKIFSAADVGFYSRAVGLQGLVARDISTSVCRVAFPVFSSISDDKLRLKLGVRKAIKTMAMLNFPLMVGLAVVAKPLVILLLTEKWMPCVMYLQLFCIIGFLNPLQSINQSVLKALGRSDLLFRVMILKKIMMVIAIAITYRWGITAIICGQMVTGVIDYYFNSYYTSRLLNYSTIAQVADLIPSLVLAVAMGMAIHMLQYLLVSDPIILLSAQVVAGITMYAIFCRIVQLTSFMDFISMARPALVKLRRAI